jgi:hypothetical protein
MTLTLLAYHSDPPAMGDAHQDCGRVSRLGLYLMKDRFGNLFLSIFGLDNLFSATSLRNTYS